MTDLVIRLELVLNRIANFGGRYLLSPIGMLPELVAAIAVAVATGLLMLIAFKYTSNQSKIKSIRDGISAELLALSIFKDDIIVNLGSQFRIVLGAFKLLLLSLAPMAVMIVPVGLLLGQLSLWWQARPVRVGEEAVVTLNLMGDDKLKWPDVRLRASPAFDTVLGPVRVRSQRAVCWNVQARESGYHRLVFEVDGKVIEKDLAIGNCPMRVSMRRPDWKWSEIMIYPAETPFTPQSEARSIDIQYPMRSSWAVGRDTWLLFWFIGSTLTALLFRKTFNVSF